MSDKKHADDTMEPLMPSRTFEDAEMDFTPMIDMTFLLLIFFLVAGKIDVAASVSLPPARYGKPVVEQSSVIVTLGAGEAGKAVVYCGNGMADETKVNTSDVAAQEDAVAAYVEREISTKRREHVLIKAGMGIKHREVARIAKAATRHESVQQLFFGVMEAK
jgi:biopolymer transport protein ExbD